MDRPSRAFEDMANRVAAHTPVAKRARRAPELTLLSCCGFKVGATLARRLAQYIDGADASFAASPPEPMKLGTVQLVTLFERLLAAVNGAGGGAATAAATAAVVEVSPCKLKTEKKLNLEVFSVALSTSDKKMVDNCIGKDRGDLDPMQVEFIECLTICFKRLQYLKITSSAVLDKNYFEPSRALSFSKIIIKVHALSL